MPRKTSLPSRFPSIKHFLALYLPTAILLTTVFVLAAVYHRSMVRNAISAQETGLASLLKNAVSSDILDRASDASFLASFLSLHLERPGAQEPILREVAKDVSLFVQNDPAYSGITLLNASSEPILRLVNSEGAARVTFPQRPAKLRPGFARYVPPPGGAFPSGYEILNPGSAENKTSSPVIRFLRPMFGSYGVPLGLLILDYDARRLCDIAQKESDRTSGYLWLMDVNAKPLSGKLPTPVDATAETALSRVWPRILKEQSGQFFNEDGLFTFEEALPSSSREPDSVWMAVTFVPPSAFTPEWFSEALALHGALLFFLAAIVWFWATARSRRAEAEMALRANEAKLAAISDSSLDAVIMIDADDTVEYWNPAAARMFGYEAGEMLGRKCHDVIVGAEDRDKALRGMASFSASGKGPFVDRLAEVTGIRKDGAEIPLELAISPFMLDGSWRAVAGVRDISERKRNEARLWELAATDGLTGIFNRRHFMETAGKGLEQARRYGHDAALVMFDVDKFKDINDGHGHDAGDAVLKKLAEVCSGALRDTDEFGRVGGEEFAIFMPHAGLDAALQAAERLRAVVEKTVVPFKDRSLSATISLGVAAFDPRSDSLDRLYSRADTALYAAKTGGRNSVVGSRAEP